MSTLRLRTLQQPSHLERLLEAVVTHQKFLPDEAYQIRDPEALPRALQAVLDEPSEADRVWACWACGDQLWLFTCQLLQFQGGESDQSLLHINRYDGEGELQDSGCWVRTPRQDWQRRVP
jgi:hypothetical protein